MARPRRRRPLDTFQDNIADAERLIALTHALLDTRVRGLRVERRRTIGTALGIPRGQHDELNGIESGDVFVVLKPNGRVRREHFTEPQLRPLLRQAIVAISAAVETYIADKACSFVSDAMRERPPRLLGISMSLGQVLDIESQFERRGWGYRALVVQYLEQTASPSPSQIGEVMATVGKRNFWNAVDARRGVNRGTSCRQLEQLYARRNRIAHSADRAGAGRATLDVADVEAHLANAKSIVETLDAVL